MWQFCLLMFMSFVRSFFHFIFPFPFAVECTPSSHVSTLFFVWFTEHWPQPLLEHCFCVIFLFHRRLIKMVLCRCRFVLFIFISFLIATNFTFRHTSMRCVVCCLAYRIHVYITIQNLRSSRLNSFLFFFCWSTMPIQKQRQRREIS